MNISNIIANKIKSRRNLVSDYFHDKFSNNIPLIYNSVDLRNAGYKIAPVDTNCYPAGFNNLSKDSLENAKKVANDYFLKNYPEARNILLLIESHTRNTKYFENIANLVNILTNNNRSIQIGSLSEEIENFWDIETEKGKIRIYKINQNLNSTFDLIILNNDLMEGVPEVLKNIKIDIVPSAKLGWYRRKKSEHFNIYNNLAQEICGHLDLDPWLISSYHAICEDVDFKSHEENKMQILAKKVEEIIKKISEKYKEYNVTDEPYCYVKTDSGTYGMAVMPIYNVDEILHFNKKSRNKMNISKGVSKTTQVIIQEGVKTIDKINNMAAEPLIYLLNGEVVGNLFRANENKDGYSNLNSVGAVFFDKRTDMSFEQESDDIISYNFVAKLAALASSCEKNFNL